MKLRPAVLLKIARLLQRYGRWKSQPILDTFEQTWDLSCCERLRPPKRVVACKFERWEKQAGRRIPIEAAFYDLVRCNKPPRCAM
jgi:hypothetical protein